MQRWSDQEIECFQAWDWILKKNVFIEADLWGSGSELLRVIDLPINIISLDLTIGEKHEIVVENTITQVFKAIIDMFQ